jgi:hypothetical protein
LGSIHILFIFATLKFLPLPGFSYKTQRETLNLKLLHQYLFNHLCFFSF